MPGFPFPMPLVQVNSQQPPNLTSLFKQHKPATQGSSGYFLLFFFFFSFLLPFHHGFPEKMKQLTQKGRDAWEEGGCCWEKWHVDIPGEPAQPCSQLSHQIPTESKVGMRVLKENGELLTRLKKELPTSTPLAQPKPSLPQPYPIPFRAATRHGLSLP